MTRRQISHSMALLINSVVLKTQNGLNSMEFLAILSVVGFKIVPNKQLSLMYIHIGHGKIDMF